MAGNGRVAAVTSVYNEGQALLRWRDHYLRQGIEARDIVVVDHASSDGSIEAIPEVQRVAFDPDRKYVGLQNESKRSDFVSGMVSQLAQRYSVVFHVDCDELLVADPAVAGNLVDYLGRSTTSTAIGYDVIHSLDSEPPLDDGLVSPVRSHLKLVAAMCKTLVVRHGESVRWAPGFHYSNLQPRFGSLFLFHLRYADVDQGLRRLALTRMFMGDRAGAINHATIDDETFVSWTRSWTRDASSPDDIADLSSSVGDFIGAFDFHEDECGLVPFDYSTRSEVTYKLPERFVGTF